MQSELTYVRKSALALVASGSPLHEVLTYLVQQAEEVSHQSVCSILLLDEDGLLRNGALPRLPPAPGMAAAWSVPIVSRNGRVLGSFGTDFRESRAPTTHERGYVEGLAQVARYVIEGGREVLSG